MYLCLFLVTFCYIVFYFSFKKKSSSHLPLFYTQPSWVLKKGWACCCSFFHPLFYPWIPLPDFPLLFQACSATLDLSLNTKGILSEGVQPDWLSPAHKQTLFYILPVDAPPDLTASASAGNPYSSTCWPLNLPQIFPLSLFLTFPSFAVFDCFSGLPVYKKGIKICMVPKCCRRQGRNKRDAHRILLQTQGSKCWHLVFQKDKIR